MSEQANCLIPLSQLSHAANALRGLAIDAVEAAASGHPGAPMGMADFVTVLMARHMTFDPSRPDWPDRDRLILSNGHASMLLYGLLHLAGYPEMSIEELRAFRQWGSLTPGHPEAGHSPGVEVTTGPLGQGLGMGVGMALAEWRLREEFGSDLCDHRIWVLAGDGCLMEGVGQEAASLAGHLGLERLVVLYDRNGISIDGSTDLAFTEDTPAKFRACGWHVLEADGHDLSSIDGALALARRHRGQPVLVCFDTVIGFGSPDKAGTASVHGAPLGAEEAVAAKRSLGLSEMPFAVSHDAAATWTAIGARGAALREAWERRLAAHPRASSFMERISGELPSDIGRKVAYMRARLVAEPASLATRKASQSVLELLTEEVPAMIGGSADLTGSNLTRTKATEPPFTRAGSGRYLNFGVREFAMGAAMNGMALHGGVIPYGGTFLVFSDYMRNAIRLAALQKARAIFVMTHDSIGLGEDGPTHQPIEHLASLRAMPGLQVFRPCDAVETLEAWQLALECRNAPSLLALSRQAVPQLRLSDSGENLTARGAYVLREPTKTRDVTLLATGTEVSIAAAAAVKLAEEGINAAVVSMPCWSLFDVQPEVYRKAVLGSAPRLAIEAASPFGWTRYVSSEDDVLGLSSFGASAPAERLYNEFGLTAEALTEKAQKTVRRRREA